MYQGFEGWDDLPNDTEAEIIQIHYLKNGSVRCYHAVHRVEKKHRHFVYDDGEVGHITLATKIPTVGGLSFGPKDRAALAAEIQPYIKRIWEETNDSSESDAAVTILAADVKRILGRNTK